MNKDKFPSLNSCVGGNFNTFGTIKKLFTLTLTNWYVQRHVCLECQIKLSQKAALIIQRLNLINQIKSGSEQLTTCWQLVNQTPGFKMSETDPCFCTESVLLWSDFEFKQGFSQH